MISNFFLIFPERERKSSQKNQKFGFFFNLEDIMSEYSNSTIFDETESRTEMSGGTTENLQTYCHNDTFGPNVPTWELSKTIVYWVEGFSLTTTAVIGILGNIVTCLVLKKLGRLQRNVFNQVFFCFTTYSERFGGFHK